MVTTTRQKSAAISHRLVPKALLAAIERDRWIGYPADDAGLLRLGELFAMRPRVRMPPS
jgi:hypothetical protein